MVLRIGCDDTRRDEAITHRPMVTPFHRFAEGFHPIFRGFEGRALEDAERDLTR